MRFLRGGTPTNCSGANDHRHAIAKGWGRRKKVKDLFQLGPRGPPVTVEKRQKRGQEKAKNQSGASGSARDGNF